MNKCSFLNHSIITNKGVYNNITIYENTIESIMYSLKNNLSIIIDICFTKDNEIVVFDKNNITKLLKIKDDVNSLTYEELEYFSQYHVSTLKEVIDKVDGKVPIILRISEDSKDVRNKLIDLISHTEHLVLLLDNLNVLKYYRKKNINVGYIINKSNVSKLNKDLDVDVLCIQYDLIDKMQSNILKQKYYTIGYTLDDKAEVLKYIKVYNNLIIDNIEEVFK